MQSNANQHVGMSDQLLPDMEGRVFEIGTVWDARRYEITKPGRTQSSWPLKLQKRMLFRQPSEPELQVYSTAQLLSSSADLQSLVLALEG